MKTKQILLFLACLGLVSLGMAQTNKVKASWKPLFNGRNLEGWTQLNGTATYEVKNKSIVGTTVAGSPNSFLCTDKTYADFILEYDFKVNDSLNSGVQIRSESSKEYRDGRVHGYQVEIDPSSRAWTCGIYDEARRGWLYDLKQDPNPGKAFKHNDWNHVRVEAVGDTIRTWLNGVPAANLADNMTHSGFIGLQVHNNKKAGMIVMWRNIKILTDHSELFKTRTNASLVISNPNTLNPVEAKLGWKLLWDGKSFAGWRGAGKASFPQKGWKVENNCLVVEGANGGDIVTEAQYGNFEFSVDFKLTKGANSGIKYFVTESNKTNGSVVGLEYQLLDDDVHPDAKLGVRGNRTCAGLYDLIPPLPVKKVNPIGEWNTSRIVVKGSHVEHWLNGVKVVEYERGTQMFRALVNCSKFKDYKNFGEGEKGPILLQDHGNRVEFRNIKIREL